MHARSENRDLVIGEIPALLRTDDTRHWVERLAPLGSVISEVSSLRFSPPITAFEAHGSP
jgi:crotonobetainyl-CoA:carnitine CoA-transferase CaiB-like acyl-CoA transferase